MRMRYRAEVYYSHTEELAAALGQWASLREAQLSCEHFARQPLRWKEVWKDVWQTQTSAYLYRVLTTSD